jgi:KaiC/GvpD/RAD55 family RecA-like ATPase
MAFVKAVKHESKLRLAITGPSGAGKTYTALSIAKHLAQPVALVDTEHGSASKYADLFEFDVMNLQPPYHPDRFVEAIRDAAQAGYRVIILDSLTHAWNGTGGMLELVDEIAKRRTGGNTFAAWKDAGPIQSRLIESIVGAPIHVIATMRSKQDYAQEKNDQGKTVIKKVGMQAQQREGFEYEFDVVVDMNIDHEGIVTKTRCPALTDRVIAKPGKEVADTLTDWLKGAPVSAPVAQVAAEPPPLWQTWKSADEAMAWAAMQFGDDVTFDTIRQQYADLKASVKPKKAAEMFQAWYESILEDSARSEAADAAQGALLDTGNPYN